MAHKVIDGNYIVDWTTGDPEGDRIYLLKAYKDFITEVYGVSDDKVKAVFERWNISLLNQIDEVPRIWIKYPNK